MSTSDAKKPENETTVAAHVFCKICGVFILRAPDKQCNSIDVNVHCLDHDDNEISYNPIKKVLYRNNGFSSGTPILSTNPNMHHLPTMASPRTPLTTISSSASTASIFHNNNANGMPQSPLLLS